MKKNQFLFYISLLIFSDTCFSQIEPTLSYSAPIEARLAAPHYPVSALNAKEEGWVKVNFMINTQGRIFEPVVIDSMGSALFQDSTLLALQNSNFTPAFLDEDPIVAGSNHNFIFQIEGASKTGSENFLRYYDNFIANLNQEQAELTRLLTRIEQKDNKNLYEHALSNWAHYLFFSKFGTKIEQIKYLSAALANSSHQQEDYLPKNLVSQGLRQLFLLYVETNYLSEAIETFDLMAINNDLPGIEKNKDTYKLLIEYKTNDISYAINAKLNKQGNMFFSLHKSNFQLSSLQGEITEVKMRCERKFEVKLFQPNLEFSIPKSWGDCKVQVIGIADTRFQVIQF